MRGGGGSYFTEQNILRNRFSCSLNKFPYGFSAYILSGLVPWLGLIRVMNTSTSCLAAHANLDSTSDTLDALIIAADSLAPPVPLLANEVGLGRVPAMLTQPELFALMTDYLGLPVSD